MSNANRKTKSKTNAMIPATLWRPGLFGRPPLLEGEDPVAYDEFFAGINAAVKPVDTVDEMLVADVAALQWEVQRWRRFKSALLGVCQREELKRFLHDQLAYDHYAKEFADDLATTLKNNLPRDEADTAEQLAHAYARNDSDAEDQVDEIFADATTLLDMSSILRGARDYKAEDLTEKYLRHEPDAIKLVNELLAATSQDIDSLMAKGMSSRLDAIEQIDRLARMAENRRNTSLREIDRRRPLLSESLRRSVKEVEEVEFQVIEKTPANGENATSKIKANRANARASTGPKTARGRVHAARNALRHGLSLPLYANPTFFKEVKAL